MKYPQAEFTPRLNEFIFLLIVFFLPTQLGLHFWPDFSFVLGMRLDYLSPTLYFTDILIFLFLIITAINHPSKLQSFIRSLLVSKHHHYQLLLFIIYITTLLMGIALAKNPYVGLYGLAKLIEYTLFILAAASMYKNVKTYKYLVLVFASGMLLQSAIAIIQFLNQGSVGGLFYYLGERTFSSSTPGIANASINGVLKMRPYATLPHPNVLAGYLLLGFIFIIGITKQRHILYTKFTNIYLYFAVLVSLTAFCLTLSRTAIFTALVLFLIYPRKNLPKLLRMKKRILLLMFMSVICITFSSLFYFRFTTLNLSDESITHRIVFAKTAIQMLKAYPVMGVGLANFLVRLPEFAPVLNTPLQPVHNIYLLQLTEQGVAGIIFIAYFIYKTFRKAVKQNKSQLNYSLLVFSAIALIGLSDHYFLTVQQGQLLLALSISIIYARS